MRTSGEPETGGPAAVFGVAALPRATEYRSDMRAAFRAFLGLGERAFWEPAGRVRRAAAKAVPREGGVYPAADFLRIIAAYGSIAEFLQTSDSRVFSINAFFSGVELSSFSVYLR